MKIYLYGYLNGIRSSRRFEKECQRNIELQWLSNSLRPNYHSISDFRKENPKHCVMFSSFLYVYLNDINLVSSEFIAIDGNKLRASNSKKNNFSPKKAKRHLQYIEDKTNEYLEVLDTADKNYETIAISKIEEKMKRLKINKIKYELLQKQLAETG